MIPTYYRLCSLVSADEVMANFLMGFQPSAYISACAQAVSNDEVILMVRNYDYHPSLLEKNLLQTSWNGKKVIAMSDCLIGILDGSN
jgi:predicted choloylglycine hydrolase